ncbi:MAG: flagellar basal-body MS-ring/collar protein FliF [Solirubrobacteraceae bacterium]
MNLSQLTSKLPARGWLAVGGSVAAVILFAYLLMTMASAPSYTTLMAGIDPAQTSKITAALSTAGIPYELQNSGTAVAVVSGQVSQARVALGGEGLLSGSTAPLQSLSNQSLGESDQQQNEAYQQALEAQLDNEIEDMQGVTSAQVDLVIPDTTTELFGNAQAASASVLLDDSSTFDAGSAKGIAELVAGAVQGLSDSKVTITDQTGDMLWPTSSDGGGDLLAQQAAEQAYDSQTAAKIDGMLAAMIGPGKAEVAVSAELDTNTESLQSVTYAKKGVALTTTTSNETLTNKGGSITGANTITGVGTNGSGNSNYADKSGQTTYGVNKTIAQTQVAPGTVNKQFISLMVDKTVPQAELAPLESAAEAAAGYVKGRDTFSAGQVAFAKLPAAAKAPASTQMLGYAKYLLVGIAALVFLVFVARMLRKRETEAFVKGQPTWLRELEAPRPLAAVEAEQLAQPTRITQLRAPLNIAKQQVEDLVEREPDRVASQVRAWMAED